MATMFFAQAANSSDACVGWPRYDVEEMSAAFLVRDQNMESESKVQNFSSPDACMLQTS